MFLLVGKGNLLVLEEFCLLLVLILGQELLRILLHHFLGICVVLQSLHEVFRLLRVNTGQVPDVLDQLLQEFSLKCEGLLRNKRPGTEHNFLSELRIGGQQPPVNEASIPEIWILTLFGDILKQILQNLLAILRLMQIQLHTAD